MHKPYQPRPCRACGGVKEPNPLRRYCSWLCNACNAKHRRALDEKRRLCGSTDPTHQAWGCAECKALIKQRNHAAAMKGAAKRRQNYPERARPINADIFWRSKAHSMVACAIRVGLLPKLDGSIVCTDCVEPAHEYDHRDYGRPLDVEPVCRSCNKRRGSATYPTADHYKFTRYDLRPDVFGEAPSAQPVLKTA